MKGLILRRDYPVSQYGQYGEQCTIGCSKFSSSRKTENVGRMAEELVKALKQESFHTLSFPGSLLDHGLRNGRRREN
jgi:hypothetical protein